MHFEIKRIYEKAIPQDGGRVLVDRVWPRGMSKEDAHLDLWLKEIAPSTELRKWFNHDPERFAEFTKRYRHELEENQAVTELHEFAKGHKRVTLLFSAHDDEHNQAVVLKEFLS